MATNSRIKSVRSPEITKNNTIALPPPEAAAKNLSENELAKLKSLLRSSIAASTRSRHHKQQITYLLRRSLAIILVKP